MRNVEHFLLISIMVGYIYKIRNKINQKVYIGQTINSVNRRISCHFKPYSSKSMNISKAVQKYGRINFGWEILAEITATTKVELLDYLNRAEIFYIAAYKSTDKNFGYNISKGGNNSEVSDETRLKISESKRGAKNPNYGKKLSEETKNKIQLTKKINGTGKHTEATKLKASIRMRGELNPNYGKRYTDEERREASIRLIGRSHTIKSKVLMSIRKRELLTEEKRENYRQAQIGEKNTMYGKSGEKSPVAKKVLQYTKDGNFIEEYISATEAGKICKISQKNISCCCTGKLKSAGGFVWRHK